MFGFFQTVFGDSGLYQDEVIFEITDFQLRKPAVSELPVRSKRFISLFISFNSDICSKCQN